MNLSIWNRRRLSTLMRSIMLVLSFAAATPSFAAETGDAAATQESNRLIDYKLKKWEFFVARASLPGVSESEREKVVAEIETDIGSLTLLQKTILVNGLISTLDQFDGESQAASAQVTHLAFFALLATLVAAKRINKAHSFTPAKLIVFYGTTFIIGSTYYRSQEFADALSENVSLLKQRLSSLRHALTVAATVENVK